MFKKILFATFALITVTLTTLGYVITRDIEQTEIMLSQGEVWFDDWFTITPIDDQTFAIGEPRYWQKNYNYLLLGENRGILFDTGPGVRNIKPAVKSLTQLPITVVSSHPHYDHIGNNHLFSQVASLDIPSIRSEVQENVFQPSFLRRFTIRQTPPFRISEWWQPNQQIALGGGRSLTIFHVPGHEQGSVALLDLERHQLFTGDFIYPGWLVAFAPTSDLEQYLTSIRYLLQQTSGKETIFGAHATPEHPSPILSYGALVDLEKSLFSIHTGEANPLSRFPLKNYSVNEDMNILFPPF